MLCLKIENGTITQVVDSDKLPADFIQVPDSFLFVNSDVRYYDNNWSPKPEDQLVAEGIIPPERTVYSTETGTPRTIREFEIPAGYTLEQPEPGQVWDGDGWVTPPPAPPSVPASVTMRQARRVLRLHGLMDAVQPAIDSLPEPDRTDAQIDWDCSATVERHRGFVLVIAQALGITDEQLDALFIEAATL